MLISLGVASLGEWVRLSLCFSVWLKEWVYIFVFTIPPGWAFFPSGSLSLPSNPYCFRVSFISISVKWPHGKHKSISMISQRNFKQSWHMLSPQQILAVIFIYMNMFLYFCEWSLILSVTAFIIYILYIHVCVCVCVYSLVVTHLCPTLGNPTDCSPPGSSVHGIFQARILECVAISFSHIYIYI